ncbi:MAG: alanine--glyoxylate aminotransferase family protein [Deltaproteobacteria bacterium]|nr:alanine--glyoxylate aminotransferase family protein [Deltaproteobacteria bacterium]
MENLLNGIEEVLLMGPGPSAVSEEVYQALSRKTLGHLDPYFIKIMDAIKLQLQALLQTENTLTMPLSGTGSAGMEAVFVNLIEPGDAVLILKNGVFGSRMAEVAGRLGAAVDVLEFEWGTPVVVEAVKQQLAAKTYKLVAVVHAETSTGVCNPVAEIGALLNGSKTLYLVDAVTSFGGMEVAMDKWGIDALYSGSQKCLSCPPGLAPVSFSQRAVQTILGRSRKVPNWYLDMSLIAGYWEGKSRAYHHTAPINMLYGLYQALYLILQEGPAAVYQRHLKTHKLLVAGLEKMGLEMLVDASCRLPMLNAVKIPHGVDDAAVRRRLLLDYKIEIGAGLGPLAGKIWRLGLMGHTARPENVERLLKALREII